jgi:hypothetical protein
MSRVTRRPPRLGLLGVAFVTLMAGLGGCGGDDDESAARDEGAPSISEKDVARLPRNSPQRAFLDLWHQAQLGNALDLVVHYHPRVRAALSPSKIAGVYSQQRTYITRARPRVRMVRKKSTGTLVAVKLVSEGDPPIFDTFILRRRAGRWVVIYDTFLERGLNNFTQSQIDTAPAKSPSARARRAGEAAARRYRDLFLSEGQPRQ